MRNFRLHIAYIITLVIIFFGYFSANAQHRVSDRIISLTEESLMEPNTVSGQKAALLKLEKAEKMAWKHGDKSILLHVYRAKSYIFHHNHDTLNSRKYLRKTKAFFKYCKDSLENALCYQMYGIIEPDIDKKIVYFLKAMELFTRHGKPENLVDIHFNLANSYRKIEKWEKAITHAKRSLQAIKQSGKKKHSEKYLHVYLLESYRALGNYKQAKFELDTMDSIRNMAGYDNRTAFEYNYLQAAAKLYYNLGLYRKAADLEMMALDVGNKMRERERARISKAMLIENELNLKKEELKRSVVENQLKQEQIKAALILIVFICSLLLFVTIVAIYQKRNAKKIRAINSVLEKQNADLEHLTKELEVALKAKTDFLNVMTHELFTPINGIAIIIQNLKADTNQKSFNRSLELLEFSSNYLYRLLKNIVDSKSIENKENQVLNRDAASLKSIIKTVGQVANIFLKTSTNTFRYFIDSKLPNPLLIDSLKLSQILINLLDNANKYTSDGIITLRIELEQETDDKAKVRFRIEDTGIGIEKKAFKIIFEKFSHGSDAIKQKYGGSGIGLYVVKHFLSLHNSKINVSSEKGNGTSFTFSIWFDKVHKITTNLNLSNQASEGSILLVDDNKVNLMFTKKLLESKLFRCDTAENGFDALEILKKNTYNLILMDIMMPGMNGFETTRYIKQLNIKTPVVALTAVDVDQNKNDFDKTEFAATIAKPFRPEDLFETIKATI